jgi:hypothetical protein
MRTVNYVSELHYLHSSMNVITPVGGQLIGMLRPAPNVTKVEIGHAKSDSLLKHLSRRHSVSFFKSPFNVTHHFNFMTLCTKSLHRNIPVAIRIKL